MNNIQHQGIFSDKTSPLYNYTQELLLEPNQESSFSVDTFKDYCAKTYQPFAFVIHNKSTQEYFGARDHLGVTPFFYCFQKNKLFFSNKLKDLLQHPEITPIINDEWLIRHLNNYEEAEDETSYSNIFRLAPAHILHIKNGTLRTSSFWEMPQPKTLNISRHEACEVFRSKLTQAVKKCLPKNNQLVACELSGGVDSSSITAIANLLGNPVHAFTHASSNGNDERNLVNDFLKMHPKISHSLIAKHKVDLAKEVQWATHTLGQVPRAGIAEFSMQLLSAASQTGAQIIFSGFGGDEGVSQRATGCAHAEFIKNRQWGHLYREAKNYRPFFWPYTFCHIIYKYFFKSKPLFFVNSLNQDFLKKEYRLPPQQLQQGLPRKSTFEYTKYLLPDRVHTAQRFEEDFQIASEFGLKYRYPLMDIELINFFNSLPAYCKVYLNQNRYLFRNETMADLMPQTIRHNFDKSIGGSTIPGVSENLNSLDKELDKEFMLKFIDQQYLQNHRNQKGFSFPIYPIIACEAMYNSLK